jgi:hypothetical protein
MRRLLQSVAILVVSLASVLAQVEPDPRKRVKMIEGARDEVAREAYEKRAFPASEIDLEQVLGAFVAFQSVNKRPGGKKTNWQRVGPEFPVAPPTATYTGRETMYSGRVTALAIAPGCSGSACKIFIGAAGGGLWEADNAMEPQPNWRQSGDGIPTNSIGTIVFDPNDPQGKTIYVGTGERTQSNYAHIGLGLYKSTDFGKSWTLIESTVPVAAGQAITSLLIERGDPRHILMGTDVAFTGMSAVGPAINQYPGRPRVGVYESFDGGQTWNPNMLNIGAGEMAFDPNDRDTLYVATNWLGVYRRSRRLHGDDLFYRILAVPTFDRTSMAVTVKDGRTRIYAAHGGANSASTGVLKRIDDAHLPVPQMLSGWTTLTSPVKGTPGYTSYAFCTVQCWFDLVVASPPGRPDTVWLGGSMNYDDFLHTTSFPSNGRTVLRSTDAGVSFTDLTRDAQSPPEGMHPDQHAIAFAPFNPDVAFIGSDGGMVRTSGSFVDASAECGARGVTGADLVNCETWLRAVPTRITSLNRLLATLQFQSVSVNPRDPWNDIMGGTQDNGTWAYDGRGHGSWFITDYGDGGQSGYDSADPNVRAHMFNRMFGAVNFRGNNPLSWLYWHDPLVLAREPVPFYAAMIADPNVSGTWFVGMARAWRTQDNGGSQEFLERYCNTIPELSDPTIGTCGDWVPLGPVQLTGTAFGTTKAFGSVAAVRRAPGDGHTLWTATSRGRLFISHNADNPDNLAVTRRLDSGRMTDPCNESLTGRYANRAITLRDCLTMTADLDWDEWRLAYTDRRNVLVAMNHSPDPVPDTSAEP